MKNILVLSLVVLALAACKKASSVEQKVEKAERAPAEAAAPAQDLAATPAAMIKEAQDVAAAANVVQAQKDASADPE